MAILGGSYAAYTRQTFQRGVVRNRDTEAVRFTSNYLQSCASGSNEYAGRTISFSSKTTNNISFAIDIYNYASINKKLVNQRDIIYDLTITMSGATAGASYTIAVDGGKAENLPTTLKSQELLGRNAHEHKYTITMPGSDLDKVKFTITAIPQNLSATNYQTLAAVIAPCTGSITSTFSYEGKYIDTDYAPEKYDGFNYEVSISSGTATGTLTWDTSVLEIDKYFLKKAKTTSDSTTETIRTIQFPMDQSDESGDYLIPFYIKNKTAISSATWDQMNTYIKFTAVQ